MSDNMLSQNFLSANEKIKHFRIALFKKDKEETFRLYELLLNELTINKFITEIMNIWIEYYLYKTFFLGIIFISLFDIKIAKNTKPYILCLLKYLINILLIYEYDSNIIKLDKANVLGYDNITKLKEIEISEPKFALFNIKELKENNETNNLAFKALYISFKNKNTEYLIKSLNTLLLNNDQMTTINSIWNFLLHNEEIYEYSSQLAFQLFESKYVKKHNKFIVLYYIFLIHIDHFQQDFLDKIETTINDIISFKNTYMPENNQDTNESNDTQQQEIQYVIVKSDEKYNEIQVNQQHQQQHQPQIKKHFKSKDKSKSKYDKFKQHKNEDKYNQYTRTHNDYQQHNQHSNYQQHYYNNQIQNHQYNPQHQQHQQYQQNQPQVKYINTKNIVSNIMQEQESNPSQSIKPSKKEIKEKQTQDKSKKIAEDLDYLFSVIPVKEENELHKEQRLNIDGYMSYIPKKNN